VGAFILKICTNCHAENDNNAKFCHECGEKLSTTETRSRANTSNKKQQNNTSVIMIIALLACLVFIGTFLLFNTFKTKTPETTTSNTTTISDANELSQYDAIISEAKKLSVEGKYKESELKLASIPVSELAKTEFSSIKDAVEKLSASNNEHIQEENKKTAAQQNATSEGTFTGDLAKWANTYTFYYSLTSQKQNRLTVSANGSVIQSNYDGTQYFGKATIESYSTDVLSYNTDKLYPVDLPAKKEITSNVKITVEWDNEGDTQQFYGYLSYSSRLVLTDGIEKQNGINEVWITY
jgi:hypothetical protein